MAPMQVQQVQLWQGQFPPPDAIERYEQTLPGVFNRIVVMAEKHQDSQFKLQTQALEAARTDTRRGHWFAFFITIFSIAGAALCTYLDQPLVASLLCGVPVLSVAKSFIDSVRGKSQPNVAQPPQTPPQG
jgi:uncharacterized membrane protein